MFLTSFQIFLIILLVIVFPVGLWNQKRMIKKRSQDLENFNYHSQRDINSLSNDEQNARGYILQNKGQYPKESLMKALINNGFSEKNVNDWLNKYY